QAEDGIRDFHVTGVQTCALPICGRALPGEALGDDGRIAVDVTRELGDAALESLASSRAHRGRVDLLAGLDARGVVGLLGARWLRSEERRVGKESSARCEG